MKPLITKASSIYGMGDALNQRAFLVRYCNQKGISRSSISVYTERYRWMFEGLGFKLGTIRKEFGGLVAYRNFGFYNLERTESLPELDKNIAANAEVDYSFEVCVPFPRFKPPKIKLPQKYITFNTGFGDFSGKVGNPDFVCLKSWPKNYWEEFVKNIGIPCVQIGAGLSCEIISGTALNLVNKLTITESAEVMRGGLFHIDMEGGLSILNQHLGKRSVVLFGPTAVENQGREFNLNIRCSNCQPCYEWAGFRRKKLYVKKSDLPCGGECMKAIKPDFVISDINKTDWLKNGAYIDKKYFEKCYN